MHPIEDVTKYLREVTSKDKCPNRKQGRARFVRVKCIFRHTGLATRETVLTVRKTRKNAKNHTKLLREGMAVIQRRKCAPNIGRTATDR